ncbi:NADPH:quinone oxidoreductase family protein [Microbaculum marinum]|uniref:NADPH:quinone oxidoreductase family protein n=1 Tax=Microbaculum marinum TaxID=1764581 RepID=A0AAW9RCQ1_9HYPH
MSEAADMTTMKAIVVREFGPLGTAKLEDMPVPEPKDGEVRIRVAAVAANFVDTLVMEGKYQFLPERPFSPGKLPVGTVDAVGAGVTRFSPGDRLLTMAEHGGYAEFVCVPESQCFRLPDGLSFDDAASVSLAYDTAWVTLTDRARLAAGDTVLVLGATGAVGLAAIQLAKAKGARVLAGVTSPQKTDIVRQAGADEIVDLSVPDLRNGLREQVHALTGGAGADIVLDPLGGDFFDAALRAVAWRGRLVVIGFASGRIPEVKANYLLLKNIEVSGVQVSDYRKRMPELMNECFEDIFALCVAGRIRPAPVQAYPLADYARALEDLLGRKVTGRAILHP